MPFAATAAEQALPALTERVIDQYVVPRFEQLQGATGKLAADLAATCDGQPGQLTAAQADFKETVLAWAGVEFLRFGPMSVSGGPERFSFWPDPRRVMQRQLAALIARRDPAALDPQALAKMSAAVQGLPALEALLTDREHPVLAADETGRYRCRLAVALAQNLAGMAHEMASEWGGEQGWRRKMLEPGPQNPLYKTPAEVAAELVRALLTGLQMIQDREVMPLIAAQANPAKAALLPFASSGLSADDFAASIAAYKAYYEATTLASFAPKDKAWIKQWIATAFERLALDGPAALRPDAKSKDSSEQERRLRLLRFQLDGIRKLVARELAPSAGLTIGFNELDGD